MMGAKTVSETLQYNAIPTWLIGQEEFIVSEYLIRIPQNA
jgi:hypothetical protein